MRGVLGAGMNRMNRYNVRRATKGLAKYLLQNPQEAQRGVVIAYDSRRFSAEFARDAALVLAQEGVPAYLFDALRPVPILSYAVRHLHAIAGIVITASHNPPQYNGYKVYAEDGAQVGPEAADGITAFIRSTPYTDCKLMDEEEAKAKGLLKIIGNKEVDDDYIAQVKTLCIQPELLAEEGSKLSIVYTPIHGSGNVPVRRILREVGISNVSVVKEQELPDPNFSTVKVPNPEDPGAFVLAIKLADEVGAKVIFATDPDCDRLGVAVKTGNGDWQLLTGNQIGCVLLHYILSTKQKQGTLPKNGAAVKSIVSTSLANKIAASFGVEMFETLTGFKFIGEKIQQFQDTGSHTFLFGFEESYGFLSSTFVRDKDGVDAPFLRPLKHPFEQPPLVPEVVRDAPHVRVFLQMLRLFQRRRAGRQRQYNVPPAGAAGVGNDLDFPLAVRIFARDVVALDEIHAPFGVHAEDAVIVRARFGHIAPQAVHIRIPRADAVWIRDLVAALLAPQNRQVPVRRHPRHPAHDVDAEFQPQRMHIIRQRLEAFSACR